MDDSEKVREEGPLAREFLYPFDRRPGARTIVATNGEYGRWKLCRVGLTLDDAIEEETNDYRQGLGDRTGAEADAYAASEPDVALWDGERCLALIRPRVGGDPDVFRFDGEDDMRPLPVPSTEAERFAWGLIKEYGAEPCRKAIVEKFIPDRSQLRQSTANDLTEAEGIALATFRRLGERESMERLYLAGPYQVIWDTVGRLGSDAVNELRRIIAAGPMPPEVRAATVIGPEEPTRVQEPIR